MKKFIIILKNGKEIKITALNIKILIDGLIKASDLSEKRPIHFVTFDDQCAISFSEIAAIIPDNDVAQRLG